MFFVIAVFCYSCKKDPPYDKGKDAVMVNTQEVKSQYVGYYDSYPGTVVACNQVELRGQVGGYITGIFFKDGQIVRKGQKLYEIDRSKFAATFEESKANYEIAGYNESRAQQDADRYIELSRADAIAKQRLEYSQTDLQNAKLQEVSAKEEMLKAEADLKYSQIIAPFDGTIGISMVKLGTLIIPGQTLLNVISSDNPMYADFVIDEKELNRFLKMEGRPKADYDSTFRMILPDKTMYVEKGSISLIDRAVDPQTGTIRVRLVFANPKRLLRTGMSCNLQILDENAGLQVVIPSKAVIEQMGEFFVYRVDGKQARQTKIETGGSVGDRIIVHKGLKDGDAIVTDGIQKLHEGSFVSTTNQKKVLTSSTN